MTAPARIAARVLRLAVVLVIAAAVAPVLVVVAAVTISREDA